MGIFAPRFDTLRDLYVNELRDLYSAETQLIEALPRMIKAATSPSLQLAFEEHLEETKEQMRRLDQLFELIGEEASGETCEAMQGLIKEAQGYAEAGGSDAVKDAGLIGAAQRIEHYEIAAYGTTRSLANRLGDAESAELLQQSLDEESNADQALTDIAEDEVNVEAELSED
jgi:ferritin-like metal-binding protein YciE